MDVLFESTFSGQLHDQSEFFVPELDVLVGCDLGVLEVGESVHQSASLLLNMLPGQVAAKLVDHLDRVLLAILDSPVDSPVVPHPDQFSADVAIFGEFGELAVFGCDTAHLTTLLYYRMHTMGNQTYRLTRIAIYYPGNGILARMRNYGQSKTVLKHNKVKMSLFRTKKLELSSKDVHTLPK